jgi:hypothetical protein
LGQFPQKTWAVISKKSWNVCPTRQAAAAPPSAAIAWVQSLADSQDAHPHAFAAALHWTQSSKAGPLVALHVGSQAACSHWSRACTALAQSSASGSRSAMQPAPFVSTRPGLATTGPHEASPKPVVMQRPQAWCAASPAGPKTLQEAPPDAKQSW